jgi:hypothetical protein
MNPKRFIILLGLTSFLLSFEEARGADFALGFEGAPERIVGAPGEVKAFDVFLTLTTTNNESPEGAMGWALYLKSEGGSITNLTIKGLKVSTIWDEDADFDPATPPIHHDPYLFDLGDSAADIVFPKNLARECAWEVVAMRTLDKIVLQPSGSQRIGKLTAQGTIPAGGGCSTLEIRFENPSPTTLCHPLDGPLAWNVVTWNNRTIGANPGSISVLLCPSIFHRGDSNSDNLIDISDAIFILDWLFLAGPPPACLDAADVNDEGAIEISDVVFLLSDLFLPQTGSTIPDPGPYACGPDPTVDGLGCERSPCQGQGGP